MGNMMSIPTRPVTTQHRKVCPIDLQKWMKKFDGSGDPYKHLANFKQLLRAEHITDWHTQFEGFGLTLEDVALTWFQTIGVGTYHGFEAMEKDFVQAFSKTGIKHDSSFDI